jgi:hypothetical protein
MEGLIAPAWLNPGYAINHWGGADPGWGYMLEGWYWEYIPVWSYCAAFFPTLSRLANKVVIISIYLPVSQLLLYVCLRSPTNFSLSAQA